MCKKEWFPAVLREDCTGPFTYPLFFKDSSYAKEKEKMNTEMPELQFGDVVKWNDGKFSIVGKVRIWSLVQLDGLIVRDSDGSYNPRKDGFNKDAVERIYRRGTGFDQEDMLNIYMGLHPEYMDGWILWERLKVREMTVEQIEKELGYGVKIIGDKENA